LVTDESDFQPNIKIQDTVQEEKEKYEGPINGKVKKENWD